MNWLLCAIAFVSGIYITLSYAERVKNQLQGQINWLHNEIIKLKKGDE